MYTSLLTDYVLEVESDPNEKIFMISNELAEISKIQKRMQETQNKNRKVIEEQFEVFQHKFHVLRDCNQMLFSTQQLSFNFDTIASLLSVLFADTESWTKDFPCCWYLENHFSLISTLYRWTEDGIKPSDFSNATARSFLLRL